MEKVPFEDEWAEAMQKEDGLKLMEYLTKEPRLLSVKYEGCNVLHLAIRRDWYGLVKQILSVFEHLQEKDDATEGASPSEPSVSSSNPDDKDGKLDSSDDLGVEALRYLFTDKEGDGYDATEGASPSEPSVTRSNPDDKDGKLDSSHHLGVEALRDLLTDKEGDGYAPTDTTYTSGLDSLGMAVIQGNMAVNTILARAILKIPSLFPVGPYSISYLFTEVGGSRRSHDGSTEVGGSRRSHDGSSSLNSERLLIDNDVAEAQGGPEGDTSTNKEEAKERFCDAMTQWFPDLTEWLRPNMSFHDYQAERKKGSQVLADGKELSEHQLPEKVRAWNLRAPYIPLAEYILVESVDRWSGGMDAFLDNKEFGDRLLRWLIHYESRKDATEYIFGIKDARRTVLHYVLSTNRKSYNRVNRISYALLVWAAASDRLSCFNVPDALGRKPMYFAFAGNTCRDLLLSGPADKHIDELHFKISWKVFRCCGRWRHDGWACKVDLNAVHEVNGLRLTYYDSSPNELTGPHIILMSPYLTRREKRDWFEFLLSRPDLAADIGLSNYFPRAIRQDGVIQEDYLLPLHVAVVKGDNELIELLVNCKGDKIKDPAKDEDLKSEGSGKSALHYAAQQADPEILRVILETGKYDVHYDDKDGNTVLHSAAFSCSPSKIDLMLFDLLEIPRDRSELSQAKTSTADPERKRYLESRRQGCINLLIQQGLDVWETNDKNRIADTGPNASPEYSLWWWEKLDHETFEQKSSFSAAATAISVTAALIATASYIGPLQPPLGYSSEDPADQIGKVQTGSPSMQVFLICNTLAFYLALAGIMLSLTPSLPMPQESTRGELTRIRRSVTAALLFLIVSILLVFAAFGSASLVVIAKGESWNHKWLTGSTLIAGGAICVIVWMICCTRAVRLLFPNSIYVRKFYKRWVFL